MSVQAKVRCISNSTSAWDTLGTSGRQVRFTPVYDTDPNHPNFQWSQWTPSGYLELQITNPPAYDTFEVGQEYLVTFDLVAPPAPVETVVVTTPDENPPSDDTSDDSAPAEPEAPSPVSGDSSDGAGADQ